MLPGWWVTKIVGYQDRGLPRWVSLAQNQQAPGMGLEYRVKGVYLGGGEGGGGGFKYLGLAQRVVRQLGTVRLVYGFDVEFGLRFWLGLYYGERKYCRYMMETTS